MPMVEVDIHAHRQFATVTAFYIAVLVAVWVHLLLLDAQADAFLRRHGVVPHDLLRQLDWRHPYRALDGLLGIGASLFLHAHGLSLAASVLFLLLFGAAVEDRIGHYRLAMLLALCGGLAVLIQSLASPLSRDALVGAPAAVAGIAGACAAIVPRGEVPTMVRGVAFPWIAGPFVWLAVMILVAALPLARPEGIAALGLPVLLLAYVAGAVMGEIYRRWRPVLLRG